MGLINIVKRFFLNNLWVLMIIGAVSCSHNMLNLKMPKQEENLNYTPIAPVEWQMPNGLRIVYIEDKELPLIRGALFIPKGTFWEPAGNFSQLSAMGYLLRQGGTKELEPDKLDLKLEKLAASVESSYSSEYGNVSFSCLSSDFEETFSLFADVIISPRFDQSRLDLWKGQMLEGIRRRTEDPSTVASISFKELIFGNGIFGRTFISSDVKQINRADLFSLHTKFVQPDNAYLAVVGDLSSDRLRTVAAKYLSGWVNKPAALKDPVYSNQSKPGIYFIKQPLEQATIYIGQPGPARLPADYMAIEAFNNIFGAGDFGARLFKKIRTELGLAYSLYGAVMHSYLAGQNIIVIQTKSESASDAAIESLNILKEMQYNLVTNEELELSKKTIRNSYIFKIDTPDDAIRRYLLLKMLKYPIDYDSTYFNKIDALNLNDIKEVASKYWDINKLTIVVVGNEKAYNSFKKYLDKNPGAFYNLKLYTCSFEEVLGKCV